MRFELGRLCATRGVAHDMERDAVFARFVADSLARYRCSDWGNVSRKIWVLTEADRSITTVLYPEEY